jgi:hypothetical protein
MALTAVDNLILTIVVVAAVGFSLAWLVGILADRDKKRRELEATQQPVHDASADPPSTPPVAPSAEVSAARPPVSERCPSCKALYQAGAKFCYSCGRERDPPVPPPSGSA